jgi:hypothetical protein
MAISPGTLERMELDIETAHGQVAAGLLDPGVDEGTKLLAAAIVQAGAEIALALARERDGRGASA